MIDKTMQNKAILTFGIPSSHVILYTIEYMPQICLPYYEHCKGENSNNISKL
jgi:hypothetical protein